MNQLCHSEPNKVKVKNLKKIAMRSFALLRMTELNSGHQKLKKGLNYLMISKECSMI
jgi:hypothetical protein